MNKSVEDRYAKAARRGYDTGKQSTGSKPAPKAKIRPTGNPLKGKIGIKWTKKF
jgi:hypothetical protein